MSVKISAGEFFMAGSPKFSMADLFPSVKDMAVVGGITVALGVVLLIVFSFACWAAGY